jgi:hypothetical protein
VTQPPDDPLRGAERQMAEHEVEMKNRLVDSVAARVSRGMTNEAAMREAVEEMIRENPELRDLAERLAVMRQFRSGGQ